MQADEEGADEEQGPTPLTAEVAAAGLSLLKDVGHLSFNYTKLDLVVRAHRRCRALLLPRADPNVFALPLVVAGEADCGPAGPSQIQGAAAVGPQRE